MNNIILGRGRGRGRRSDSMVMEFHPQPSTMDRGTQRQARNGAMIANIDPGQSIIGSKGPAKIDEVDPEVYLQKSIIGGEEPERINLLEAKDHQQSIIGKGDLTSDAVDTDAHQQKLLLGRAMVRAISEKTGPKLSIIGREEPTRSFIMPKTEDSPKPIIGRGRATLQKNSQPVCRLGESDRGVTQGIHWLDKAFVRQPGICMNWNLPKDSSHGIDHDKGKIPFATEMNTPKLAVQTIAMDVVPRSRNSVQFSVWPSLGCNEDFPSFPPFLQMTEQSSPEQRKWKVFKCTICYMVCPPPPYSCKSGHILCFSCTSVQKASTCPIRVLAEKSTERVSCKRLLVPRVQKEHLEEYMAHNKTKYSCPFKRVGCCQSETLLPQEVVEHAQKQCPYRYQVKCFIGECEENDKKFRVGFYKEHCVTLHGSRIIELGSHRSNEPLVIPYDLYAKPFERILIPILFVEQLDTEIMFPLMMMRTEKFIYLWIYQIAALEGSLESFHANLVLHLRLKKNVNDQLYGKPMEKHDVNHDISVPIKDVVQSGNVIKVDIRDFCDRYLTSYNKKEEKEVNRHFYLLKVDILRDSDKVLLSSDKFDSLRISTL